MIDRDALCRYCDEQLQVARIKDYCPNGLQVEGRAEIRRILCGVTASQALLDHAVAQDFDAVLVHHGYFWRGEPSPITGMRQRRIATLLRHDINLIAYHLPLDVHPQWGNNAQLLRRLGCDDWQAYAAGGTEGLLLRTTFDTPISGVALAQRLQHCLSREPLWIDVNRPIAQLALCTGGAQDFIIQAAELGADAFISGEISERTTHLARELGLHYYAAGHHATERYGVQSLGEHLAHRFSLQVEYLELDNPA